MDFRTDLALERIELTGVGDMRGIEKTVRQCGSSTVTVVNVSDENGEKLIGKPLGKYITVDVPSFSADGEMLDGRLDGLIEELRQLIPCEGNVLVVGLGNRNMTADALGPACTDKIFVTRHIGSELASALGFKSLRSVAAVAPGVLGSTGMEAFEIISGIVEKSRIKCVIAVDALAAMDMSRLGATVQLSDTGISPGSGIGNKRSEISKKTLGIPVIAVGVPTVISAYTLVENILREIDADTDISKGEKFKEYIVASREADIITERASKFISLALNSALQPDIRLEDLMLLM